MDKSGYFNVLYPLQDEVLGVLRGLETGFYLTGGTAASRGYLHHRFSDDLDLFTNDAPQFSLWAEDLQRLGEALLLA
jgi:predicted nucleotidyltransferase component of viral defense system